MGLRLTLAQISAPHRQALEEAVTLADRYLRTCGMGLAWAEEGTLRLLCQGRPVSVRLAVGGFPKPGRRFSAMAWRSTVRFRTVPSATGSVRPPEDNTLFLRSWDRGRRSPAEMTALLVHELAHIEQQERCFLGPWGFLVAYAWGWARGGFRYRTNPYEVAAEARAQEALRSFGLP